MRGMQTHVLGSSRPAAPGGWTLRHGIIVGAGGDSERVDNEDCVLPGTTNALADRNMLGGGTCRCGHTVDNGPANAYTGAPVNDEQARFTSYIRTFRANIDHSGVGVVLPAGDYLVDAATGLGTNAPGGAGTGKIALYDSTGWGGSDPLAGSPIFEATFWTLTAKGVWAPIRGGAELTVTQWLARTVDETNMVRITVPAGTGDAQGIHIQWAHFTAEAPVNGYFQLAYIRIYEES